MTKNNDDKNNKKIRTTPTNGPKPIGTETTYSYKGKIERKKPKTNGDKK